MKFIEIKKLKINNNLIILQYDYIKEYITI